MSMHAVHSRQVVDAGVHACLSSFSAVLPCPALRCRSIAERLKASANFQVLITSRQLPTQPYLYKVAEVPCAFSYSLDGRAYIYVKSLQEAPAAVLARIWCRKGVCWLPSMSQMQLGVSVDELLSAEDPSRFVQGVSPAVVVPAVVAQHGAGDAAAVEDPVAAAAAEPSSLQ